MHKKLKYICNYKEDERYRRSFSQLAFATFGLDFERWYQQGFWDSNYICYSYAEEDRIVANVSAYRAQFMVDNVRQEGIQLVTGMTCPAYRGQGLMGTLIKDLLQRYTTQADFLYIAVANKPMMPFWLKLGFTVLAEKQFFIAVHPGESLSRKSQLCVRKLDMLGPEDVQLLFALAARRLPTARNFYLENTQHAVMLYCLHEFSDHIYYLPTKEVVAIYKQEAGILHLYDLLFSQDRKIAEVLKSISNAQTREIVFHFVPEFDDLCVQSRSFEQENIFAARPALEFRGDFCYPAIG